MSSINVLSLKNTSEIFRNIVIGLAVLIGGIWTVYTFNMTLQVENSEAKLQSLNRLLDERAVINTRMAVEIVESKDGEHAILARVYLINTGKKLATLIPSSDLFTIALTEFENGTTRNFSSRAYSNLYYIPTQDGKEDLGIITAISLNPGQERELQAVFKVSEPGVYKIDFKVTPSKELSERIIHNLGGDALEYDKVRVYAASYFVVP